MSFPLLSPDNLNVPLPSPIMPIRPLNRQPDRDPRLHDPSHPHLHPHQPTMNGVSPMPATPVPLPNGPNTIVTTPSVPSAVPNGVSSTSSSIHKLASANEQTWLLIGRVAEQMGDLEHALSAYENALRHNPVSLSGLTQVAGIARIKENYPKAVEYFQRVVSLQEENGEVWSALGHCYLMQDDLQKAYSAYQQALYLLPNPKEDPKLWYGIGILYDRYGSLDHAEEAFSSVLRMDKDFDKANEILFRLGIIYKQQRKYDESLQCFDRILRNPPSPLAHADIWFQIGHVYEQQKDYVRAKDAYERVVHDNPRHPKVLQQLGWLYHQNGSAFQNQDHAIQYLTKSLEADPSDAQSWYLLGRAYMAGQKYNKAYEAYQQAVYRDGRNPTFWCSIGVLYFQINQYRDALDAYSRAIRINPYISEVWFALGTLYESCNNQISDAIDAYARASELDPSNHVISQRLQLVRHAQATGAQLPAAPGPQDVHPTAYASAVVPPPPGLTGPPLLLQAVGPRPVFRADSRGPPGDRNIALPPPSQVGASRNSPGPFRGGPPPPVVLDESRHHPSHTPLGPMDVDRPHHSRDYPPRDGPPRGPTGPAGHQSLLLHHPVPQQQAPPDDIRNGASHGPVHHPDPYFSRPPPRAPSRSVTPPPSSSRIRSPPPSFSTYSGSGRQPVGPGQSNSAPSQRSPRSYVPELMRSGDHEVGWERRPAHGDHPREWDRERRPRHSGDYVPQPPSVQQHQQPPPHPSVFYPQPRTPPRRHSPEHSPRSMPRAYWEGSSSSTHPPPSRASPPPPPGSHQQEHAPPPPKRYDPRHDGRESRDPGPPPRREPSREIAIEQRNEAPRYSASPEGSRAHAGMPLPPMVTSHGRRSPSPRPTPMPEPKERRRRGLRDRDSEAPPAAATSHSQEPPKKENRKRTRNRRKDDQSRTETPTPKAYGPQLSGPGSFKHAPGMGSPGPSSSNASSRSMQPSPTNATPRIPPRFVDENYDEGVEDALMGLAREASSRAPEAASVSNAEGPPTRSPTVSSGSRHADPSPRPHASHRESVSSTRSHASSSSQPNSLKRALSQGPDDMVEPKRTRMDVLKRRASPQPVMPGPSGRRSPQLSTRPSPIPFRTQPAAHSPETRQALEPYRPTSPLPAVLPPHPRPSGLASHMNTGSMSGSSHSNNASSVAMAYPPITTLSPTSTEPSPSGGMDREERGQSGGSRSSSPPSSRAKLSDLVRASGSGSGSGSGSRSPTGTKHGHPSSPTSSMRDKMDTN